MESNNSIDSNARSRKLFLGPISPDFENAIDPINRTIFSEVDTIRNTVPYTQAPETMHAQNRREFFVQAILFEIKGPSVRSIHYSDRVIGIDLRVRAR